MRAIGYFRTVDGQGSLADLEGAFAEFCDLNTHQPVRSFADTGPPKGGKRTGYLEMLEFMRDSGSSFLAVIPDARHLGHDLESVARAVVELEATGAKVTCADEEYPDPLQNALQRLGVKGVSRTRSASIKESMKNRALKGQGLGKPPFGYRNGSSGTLEVVEEEAPVVELLYRLYTKDGLGLRLIAQRLNERGITTRRGGKWNMVTIRDILRNPTYMGTYTRFGLRLPKSHSAIISPEVFRMAQGQTRSRRPVGRVSSREPFLLSGLAYCGYCGNKMMGVTRRQAWKRKDGGRASGVYRYYQCQSRNNLSVCGYHTWRAPVLEGTVSAQLRHALRNETHDTEGSRLRHQTERNRDMWRKRVSNAERRFVQALHRAARGEASVEDLGRYLVDLDTVRDGSKNSGKAVDVDAVMADWESLDFATRRGFLTEHLDRIVVRDDTVEVAAQIP